jgi:hypothetical protein
MELHVKNLILTFGLAAALFIAACGKKEEQAPTQAPPSGATQQPTPPPAAPADPGSGTVTTTPTEPTQPAQPTEQTPSDQQQ